MICQSATDRRRLHDPGYPGTQAPCWGAISRAQSNARRHISVRSAREIFCEPTDSTQAARTQCLTSPLRRSRWHPPDAPARRVDQPQVGPPRCAVSAGAASRAATADIQPFATDATPDAAIGTHQKRTLVRRGPAHEVRARHTADSIPSVWKGMESAACHFRASLVNLR